MQRSIRSLRGGAGRLLEVPLFSEILGRWRSYAVWLPPDYGKSRRRYPVMYLFRGHHVEWQKPHATPSGYTLLHHRLPMRTVEVHRVMQVLVCSAQVRPFILVMPCMSNHDGTLSGLATDWVAPHLARGKAARGVGTGRFGRHFVEEIVPHVDAHFRTIAERYGRVADGFSLGGFMALKVALSQPHLFGGVGAYDGSFFYLHHRPGESGDYLMDHSLFDPVFDRPRRLDHVTLHSPAALLMRASDYALGSLRFHLQCGPQQAEPMDSNFYRTMHMVRLLQMRGISNQADPYVIEDGHHDWPTAFRHLAQTLECFSDLSPPEEFARPYRKCSA